MTTSLDAAPDTEEPMEQIIEILDGVDDSSHEEGELNNLLLLLNEEYVKTNCRTYNTCSHNEEDKIPEDERK